MVYSGLKRNVFSYRFCEELLWRVQVLTKKAREWSAKVTAHKTHITTPGVRTWRITHTTKHQWNESKKTESILILLMTLVGNFNGDVELYNWTGESDHIYWENSYKIPCPWFFVSRTKVFQCLWDFSSCWKIIMQKFSFILFMLYPKVTLIEKRSVIVLII